MMSKGGNMEAGDRLEAYTVIMHLQGNAKAGKALALFLIAGIGATLVFRSIWPIAVGASVSVISYIFIMQSCVRFVQEQTGFTPSRQAALSSRYKSDPSFAAQVNEMKTKVSP